VSCRREGRTRLQGGTGGEVSNGFELSLMGRRLATRSESDLDDTTARAEPSADIPDACAWAARGFAPPSFFFGFFRAPAQPRKTMNSPRDILLGFFKFLLGPGEMG
jgi:hypothetical protein